MQDTKYKMPSFEDLGWIYLSIESEYSHFLFEINYDEVKGIEMKAKRICFSKSQSQGILKKH